MSSRETRRQASRLFIALEFGEQLASTCAQQQALLTGCDKQRRFLRNQARQEAMHARFFRYAAQYLGYDRKLSVPGALHSFAKRLEQALHRRDLVETLVGQQIVLEGFGAAILERLNTGMDNQGIGLKRLRRMILSQEKSHHAFGDRLLQQRLRSGALGSVTLHTLSSEYLALVDNILAEMSDVFYVLDEEPACYRDDLYSGLPDYLKEVTGDLDHHARSE